MAKKSIIDVDENTVFDLEEILTDVIKKLKPLDSDNKRRVLDAISTFYSLGSMEKPIERFATPSVVSKSTIFSDRQEVSAKEFLREKNPRSDIEKVVCLAYFLSHYRETPHFKTIDISKLNTEAAQLKFSNAAYAVDNASKRGFLVPAGKTGLKRISSMGEQFVSALPDREEAKSAMERLKSRRPSKKNGSRNKNQNDSHDDNETND